MKTTELKYNHYYDKLSEVDHNEHIFVFTSNKDGSFGSSSGLIASKYYARTTKNNTGYERTIKGSTFGVVIKDESLINSIPHDEIEHSLRVLYYLVIDEPELSLILPDFSRGLKESDAVFVDKICKELFTDCHIKNKFFIPISWNRFKK